MSQRIAKASSPDASESGTPRHSGDTSRTSSQGVLGNIAHYAFSNIMRQVLGVISAVVRPMLLSPAHYGLWNLLKTIPSYTTYTHLGARAAARYAIPFNQANGLDKKNEQVAGTLFWGSLILSLIPACALGGWAIFGTLSMAERWGLGIMAVYVLVWWLYEYALTLLKAYQRFHVISLSNYLMPLLTFVTLPLLWIWDIYGLYISFLACIVGVTWFFLRRQPLDIARCFSWKRYLSLVRTGFPIMALGLVIVILRTVDRFVITLTLGNEELGFYSIAVMVLNFIMNIPMATREVIEPKMMQSMQGERFLEQYYISPLYHTALYLPLLMGPVFFLMPHVITLLLPNYLPGIPCIMILALGGYFMALMYMTRGVLVAWRQQAQGALLGLPVIIVNVALALMLVRLGWGIEGVAAAASVSMAVYFLVLNELIRRNAPKGSRGLHKAAIMVFVPFAVLMGPGFGLYAWMESIAWSSLLKPVLGLVVYYVCAFGVILTVTYRVDELEPVSLKGFVGSVRTKMHRNKG